MDYNDRQRIRIATRMLIIIIS